MNTRSDHMTLAAFASASTTYGEIGSWMHPRTDPGITEPDYYINLARTLDRGGFDLLFFDDRLAMPAAYRNSIEATAQFGSRAVKLDILTILALVASHTERIGLGATYSTSYYAPYHVARAFATLDHLSRGRAVWNIVTSLNSDEAKNFGVDYLDPATRYDRADEFLEIATGLWESWEHDALQMNRETGVFADPAKVRELNYTGKWLSSKGPLTVPQPPQGWPVLLQAGQSDRGVDFAARWADLTFTGPRNLQNAQEHYRKQNDQLIAAGREPGATKVLPAVQVFVAEDAETAQARLRYFNSLSEPEEELIVLSEQANFDFSQYPMDEPIPDNYLDSVQGARGLVQRYVEAARDEFGPQTTLRQLAESQAHNTAVRFVGNPEQVADQMSEWFLNDACDGFAIIPTDTPGSFEDFVRLVIPILERRGFVDTSQKGSTLRDRLSLHKRTSDLETVAP